MRPWPYGGGLIMRPALQRVSLRLSQVHLHDHGPNQLQCSLGVFGNTCASDRGRVDRQGNCGNRRVSYLSICRSQVASAQPLGSYRPPAPDPANPSTTPAVDPLGGRRGSRSGMRGLPSVTASRDVWRGFQRSFWGLVRCCGSRPSGMVVCSIVGWSVWV
jgi:hypothetical protein